MDDTCLITRDSQGGEDDVLNQTTGAVTPPTADKSTVYSGRCYLSGYGAGYQAGPRGGGIERDAQYTLSLPLSCPDLREGDVAVMTSARRDRALVGIRFVVKNPVNSTFAVSRKAVLKRRGVPQ